MTSRSFARVKVIFEWSPKINGVPPPDMEWSIRRAISWKSYAEKARFVIVTCGWHEGGHPEDAYPDPLEHCTFRVLDAEKNFVVTLHAHPEDVIPEGMATKVDWRKASTIPPLHRLINSQLRKASGMPGTCGLPRPSIFPKEDGPPQGRSLRQSPSRHANKGQQELNPAEQSPSEVADMDVIGKQFGETKPRTRTGEPPMQDRLVAFTAQLSLEQGKLTEGSLPKIGSYVPRHLRENNNNFPNPTQVADSSLSKSKSYVPPHLRNTRSSFPKSIRILKDPLSKIKSYVPPHRRATDSTLLRLTNGAAASQRARNQDLAVDRRAITKPHESRDRPPLGTKSTNMKIVFGQAESEARSEQNGKKKPGPNDRDQNGKAIFTGK